MKGKPKIDYPCFWGYTVIGYDQQTVSEVIENVLVGKKYTVHLSKKSAQGIYCSLRISVKVMSEQERLQIYNELSGDDRIKVVL